MVQHYSHSRKTSLSDIHPSLNGSPALVLKSVPSQDSIQSEVSKLTKSLQQATHVTQLNKLVSQIDARQMQIDEILNKFILTETISHQSSIRSCEISRVELSTTLNHSRTLKKILETASSLSVKITEKVRILDSEKHRIVKTKDYVENVKLLKTEILKANQAIKGEDWLSAATSISIIRNLPESLINDEFVEFIVPTSEVSDMPSQLLEKWIAELTTLFVDEFNKAAQAKNVPKLSYFFQLFPLIGKDEIGLKCYSTFVCNIISEQSRTIVQRAQGRDSKPDFYAQILFQLFQVISEIVHQHSRIIKRYYGSSVIPRVLTAIQVECDLQSGLIFDTFWDSKNLGRALDAVSKYDYPVLIEALTSTGGGSSSNNMSNSNNTSHPTNGSINNGHNNNTNASDYEDHSNISLLEVENLIEELSTMLNHWSMYVKFFVVTWNESLNNEKHISSNTSNSSIYPRPLLISTFAEKIKTKIFPSFDKLCTFASRKTVERAYQIEQLPDLNSQLITCVKFLTYSSRAVTSTTTANLLSISPDDPPITSMIDDITVALNLIMLQTLSCGQLAIIRNMISNVRRILETDFLNLLSKKLQDYQPRMNSQLLTQQTIQSIQEILAASNTLGGASGGSALYSTGSNSQLNLLSPRSGTPPLGGSSSGSNSAAAAAANTSSMFMKTATSAITSAININGTEAENSLRLSNYISILNSISVFDNYLLKLTSILNDRLKSDNLLILDDQEVNVFKSQLDGNDEGGVEYHVSLIQDSNPVNEKIRNIIQTLHQSFDNKVKIILNYQIKLLFDLTFKTKINTMINEVFKDDEEYLVSSIESSYSSSEPVLKFLKDWNSLMTPYLTCMSRENFSNLIEIAITHISGSIQSKIWGLDRKVNELGANKLEKNISLLIGEITKFDYGLRNKFIKVTQIIMVLCLEDDEEIDDFEDIDWVLTPVERNRARNLRIDRK